MGKVMDIRIWCEFTSPKAVCQDFVIELFKRHNVTLNYKLEYKQDREEFYDMVRLYNKNNIPISIWATLSDEMGYWINEHNAEAFDKYVRELTEKLEERDLRIRGFCIDMETSLTDIQNITSPNRKLAAVFTYMKMITVNLNKKRYTKAKEMLQKTAEFLKEKRLESYATCIRHCYYDLKFDMEIIQNALEIPVFDIAWDKYNLMYYATMIRNEMKSIKRVNVDFLIYHQVKHLKEKLGDKLAVSVGLTNIGKLGTEPFYENLEDFERDMGVMKACKVDDFALFSLDGILEKEKLEGFLNIMRDSKPYIPEYCNRVIRNEMLLKFLFKIVKLGYKLLH